MGLERATFVTTAKNGRLEFRSSDGELEIRLVDSDGTTQDSGSLSEDDLRSLLKDAFPAKRGPRKAKAANGRHKKAQAETVAA